jgi:hypothetical protein
MRRWSGTESEVEATREAAAAADATDMAPWVGFGAQGFGGTRGVWGGCSEKWRPSRKEWWWEEAEAKRGEGHWGQAGREREERGGGGGATWEGHGG